MYSDVNCDTNNGGCDSKRTCTKTSGGRTCGNCPSGWTNDGDTGCTVVDTGGDSALISDTSRFQGSMFAIIVAWMSLLL